MGRPSIKFKRKSELNEDLFSNKSVISIKGENDFSIRLSNVHQQKDATQKSNSSMNLNEGLGEVFSGGK